MALFGVEGHWTTNSGVVGILQAVTYLLDQGFQPQRTIYLSFGHDEEIGGRNGAGAVTALLKQQGVQLGLVTR